MYLQVRQYNPLADAHSSQVFPRYRLLLAMHISTHSSIQVQCLTHGITAGLAEVGQHRAMHILMQDCTGVLGDWHPDRIIACTNCPMQNCSHNKKKQCHSCKYT